MGGSYRFVRAKLAARGLLPTTVLGRVTAYLVGLDLLLVLISRPSRWVGFQAGAAVGGWVGLLTFISGLLLLLLALRWVRHHLMWRLRNRLIVTYVFIGVIPVVLLLAMAFLASYMFGLQFATYVATSDIDSELRAVQSTNMGTAAALAARVRRGEKLTAETLNGLHTVERMFPRRQITVWFRGDSFVAPAGTQPVTPLAGDNVHVITREGRQLYFRALRRLQAGSDQLTVITSIPIDTELLASVVERIGELEIRAGLQADQAQAASATADELAVHAGTLPAKSNRIDYRLDFFGYVPVTDWRTGASKNALLVVTTRPSLLYARLAASFGADADKFIGALIAIAIALAMVELLALIIGIRLTRTMTRSVAALYDATQHVNRGDFQHRITIKSQDQLAALETSFNSMTESIEKLLQEQKEKQRIEHELAIAQEVQEQLFPQAAQGLPAIEVHGICRPARTVSGDYYDFLPLGDGKLALAVGDISGKGISAALLMATIHSAVRAYTLERQPAMAAVPGSVGAMRSSAPLSSGNGVLSPASLMAMLNRQLYGSTPAEKYATLFLCIYEGRTRQLTYCNAGHLPPIVFGQDGSMRRLECGGTVTGLFGDVTYDEATVELRPGEMLLAYSDGVTEPENEFGEFGEERLIQLVRENLDAPLARISDEVLSAVSDWIGGNEQPDDVTLVLARAR